MKIDIDNEMLVLSEVWSGVGIQTDMGLFGISQRDGGIEVLLNGKSVWTSHAIPRQEELGASGVRDPNSPCDQFEPGEAAGFCETDGHYLCAQCVHRRKEPKP